MVYSIIIYIPLDPQDDQNSETVHSLDADIKTSFKKFKNTSLDAKSAGMYMYSVVV